VISIEKEHVMMAKSERTFLPAAGHDLLLPIYDPFTKLFGFDRVRRMLLDRPRCSRIIACSTWGAGRARWPF